MENYNFNKMEILKMGDLSLAHVSPETYQELTYGKYGPYVVPFEYGAFVHVPDNAEDEEPCSRDLAKVLRLARCSDVAWLKLDSDALQDDRLPLYEWEAHDGFTVVDAIKQKGWIIECDIVPDCRAICVRIAFVGAKGKETDETEFVIKPFDAAELADLFEDFCAENRFFCNCVESVSVVSSYDVDPEEVDA